VNEDEEFLEEQDDKGEQATSDSDSNSDDNDDGKADTAAFHQMQNTMNTVKSSIWESIRVSMKDRYMREEANAKIVKEIHHLAHDLVPELRSVKA